MEDFPIHPRRLDTNKENLASLRAVYAKAKNTILPDYGLLVISRVTKPYCLGFRQPSCLRSRVDGTFSAYRSNSLLLTLQLPERSTIILSLSRKRYGAIINTIFQNKIGKFGFFPFAIHRGRFNSITTNCLRVIVLTGLDIRTFIVDFRTHTHTEEFEDSELVNLNSLPKLQLVDNSLECLAGFYTSIGVEFEPTPVIEIVDNSPEIVNEEKPTLADELMDFLLQNA
jgi:hypothetical protein